MANNYTQATVLPDLPAAVFSASELNALSACGLSNEESKGMLYFFAQEFFSEEAEGSNGETVNCTALLQAKLHLLDIADYPGIVIEGATICSKMRPGEFGGFAYRITRSEVQYMSTWQWLRKNETTKVKSNSTDGNRPIVIEVRGGVVQDVRNVPTGVEYEILDYDNLEDTGVIEEAAASPLPPDPEGMNDARTSWAAKAIAAFQEATGTDEADALCDLLADLMHWSDRKKYDFDRAFLRAQDHYHAETLPVNNDEPVRKNPAKKEKRHVG